MAEKKEKRYVSDNAQLMAEWDWEANTNLNLFPNKITHGSTKKVNWICEKGHHYSARVDHRTIMGSACPYCANKQPIIGQNDLATTHPELLLEWDYTANIHNPSHYLEGSNKKVSWICKNCGHHWSTRIIHRALKKTGCPKCAGIQRGLTKTKSTILKKGPFETEFPELRLQWDDDKNVSISLSDVHSNSKIKVWWKCSRGHLWKATVANRTAGNGCPICAGKKLLIDFNDLETKFPAVAAQWHPTLNGHLSPNQISAHNDRKVWWCCPECGESYFTSIYSRTSLQTACPICANRHIISGINDLATTHPDIAQEWNVNKNGCLVPTDLVGGSNKKVWWKCKNNHEWQATVVSRSSGRGCPICARERRSIGRQKTLLIKNGSLLSNYPEIATQWHPTKNRDLSPDQVTSGSSRKVWWMCERGHEWEAIVYSRVGGRDCPYCNYEHSTSFPEQAIFFYLSQVSQAINRYKLLGKEIDIYLPALNLGIEYNGRYYHGNRTQQDYEKYAFLKAHGVRVIVIHESDYDLVDGDDIYYHYKNSDYLNMNSVIKKVFTMCSLPQIHIDVQRDRTVIYEQYIQREKASSLAARYPWVIDEWDYEKNGKLTPWMISCGSNKRIHWKCKKCGYGWESVAHTQKVCGCPACANRVVLSGVNDLATTHPYLAEEWDDKRNDKKPTEVVAGSHQYAWWVCKKGHSWKSQIKSRKQGTGCPQCARLNLHL